MVTVEAGIVIGSRLNGTIVVENRTSWCAHSFTPYFTQLDARPPNSSSYFHFRIRPNAILSIINVGSGTTGTSLIFQVLCAGYKLNSAHWTDHCIIPADVYTTSPALLNNTHSDRTGSKSTAIAAVSTAVPSDWFSWFKMIDSCVVKKSRETQCTSQAMLETIKQNLIWAVERMHTLSDYPYSNFLPELLALSPHVQVALSPYLT